MDLILPITWYLRNVILCDGKYHILIGKDEWSTVSLQSFFLSTLSYSGHELKFGKCISLENNTSNTV